MVHVPFVLSPLWEFWNNKGKNAWKQAIYDIYNAHSFYLKQGMWILI